MSCAMAWCGSSAIDQAWADRACPEVSAAERAEFVAAGYCATHTIQHFGHAITRRGEALEVKLVRSPDGTIDAG